MLFQDIIEVPGVAPPTLLFQSLVVDTKLGISLSRGIQTDQQQYHKVRFFLNNKKLLPFGQINRCLSRPLPIMCNLPLEIYATVSSH